MLVIEPEHWPDAALDRSIILLNPGVQVFALTEFKRHRLTPRAPLQATFGVTGSDGVAAGAGGDEAPVHFCKE